MLALTVFFLIFLTFLLFAKIVKDAFVFRLFFIGYIIRVLVMYLDCYEYVGIPGNGDEWQFHITALDNQTASEAFHITNYTVFLTFIYKLTDCSRLIAQYINVMMGMAFLFYLDKTLKLVNAKQGCRKQVLVIATFMPNIIFFAAILLREAWIEMFVMMSVYYFVRWFLKGGKMYELILSFLFVICATWMHAGCITLAAGFVLCLVIYDKRTQKIHLSRSLIPSLVMVSLFFVVLVLNAGMFMDKFGSLGAGASEDMMVDIYTAKVEAGSTYLDWLNVTSPLLAVVFAPLKMFYFLFSPIPFDWRNLVDAIAFALDSTVYIFLFYQIAKRKSDSKEKKYLIRFLLIGFFFATFVFAFGTIASGTAMRHRAKIIAILFVCYGLTRTNNQNKTKDYNLCVQ